MLTVTREIIMFLPVLLVFYFFNCSVLGLKLIQVDVPSPVSVGDSVVLKCIYDLEGSDLYSIKWYKDNQEFYRFIPKTSPRVKVFDTEGVNVDLALANQGSVRLKRIKLSSSGKYKCEVSGDAPDFQTLFSIKRMDVYSLPKTGPRITGGKTRYQIGDHVDMNCTSARSKPAAKLTWYINDLPAEDSMIINHGTIPRKKGLESSSLGLRFSVKEEHLRAGRMKFKCVGVVGSKSKTYEESVLGGYRRISGTDKSVSWTVEGGVGRSTSCPCLHVSLSVLIIWFYNKL